jgi:hypothetical protein
MFGSAKLYVYDDKRVDRLGVEQPAAEIQYRNREYIVLKVPGHQYWSARAEQSYAAAEFQVYKIINVTVDKMKRETIECEYLFDFPIRKPK